MGLTSGQARFASVFAQETGLDPHVVGAWLLAEQSGSAAQFYQRKGYNNWLNIARTDSGDAPGSHGSVWANPDTAAKASAEWMRGQGPIARSYGKPASGIMAILGAHGQGAHRQIQAIARSGWASSGYNGGSTLSALLGQTGDIHAQAASARGRIESEPSTESTKQLDKAAFAAAQQKAAGIRNIAGLFPGNKPGDEILREALEKAGVEPSEDSFKRVKTIIKTDNGTYHVPVGSDVTRLNGVADFHGHKVAAWIAPVLHYVEAHGVKPEITSGYRSRADQERIYNSGVRPAARPGTSNHEFTAFPGGAVDIANAEAVNRVLTRSPYAHLLVYAGSKDPVHFSHPHNGSY